MKKFILLYVLAPAAMYGMNGGPQIVLPNAYIQAVRSAHTVANSVAAITRAKSKMTKIFRAGFIAGGIGTGAYLGLKILSNQNMFNRCAIAVYAALGISAIGFGVAKF